MHDIAAYAVPIVSHCGSYGFAPGGLMKSNFELKRFNNQHRNRSQGLTKYLNIRAENS